MTRARRSARSLLTAFIILNAVAVTFPGVIPFNRTRPFVLGLPFVLFWVTLWIVIGLIVLLIVDRIESR